jgi:putative ABC transport system substrate-binding protein
MKGIVAFVFLLAFASGQSYPGETVEIAVVKSRDLPPYNLTLRGFKNHLNDVGIRSHVREATLKGEGEEALSNIRRVFESYTPDLVLALGTPAARAAQSIVKDVPVLFTMVLDPKASNLLPPGVVMAIPHDAKLGQLKRVLPDAKRIGLVYSQNSTSAYEGIARAATRLGLQLVAEKIDSGKELAEAIEDISWQIDCFLMITDSTIYFPRSVEYLLRHGLRKKIPVVGLSSYYTKAGALISFDCDYEQLGSETADIALKLLSGADPSNIGFLAPGHVNFSLNLLVADRIGIKIPPHIITEAREVFGK